MDSSSEHSDTERRLARALAGHGDQGPGVSPAGVHERAAVLRRRRAGVVSGVAALALALPVGLVVDAVQGAGSAPVAAPTVAVTTATPSRDPGTAAPTADPTADATADPPVEPSPSAADEEPPAGAPQGPPLERDASGALVVPQQVGSGLSAALPGAGYYGYLPFPSGAFLQNVVAACMENTPDRVQALLDGGGSWTYVLDEEERGVLYGSADVRVDLYAEDGARRQLDHLRDRADDCGDVMALEVAAPTAGEEALLVAAGAEQGTVVTVVGAEPGQGDPELTDPDRASALAVAVVAEVQVRAAVSRRGDGTGPEVQERVRAESLALLEAAVAEVVEADVPARAEAAR